MGGHTVARRYEVTKTGEPLSAKKLQLQSTELKRLYARQEALHIQSDGVLEIRLIVN